MITISSSDWKTAWIFCVFVCFVFHSIPLENSGNNMDNIKYYSLVKQSFLNLPQQTGQASLKGWIM